MAKTTLQITADVAKMRGYIATYLNVPVLNDRQRAALATDLKTLDADLAQLEQSLKVATPISIDAPAAAPSAPADATLTYDEETPIFLDAEDELLKAEGKPYGRDGAERGALPLSVHIDLARKLNLPLHLAEFEAMVVPGASQ